MKSIFYLILFIVIFSSYSCKKEGNAYIDGNAPAPMQVSNLKVTSISGGAILTYKIPNDSNLSHVRAEYEIQPGVFREAKSSYYTDTLELVGYGDTLSHEAKIYSVGRNGQESEPLTLNIKPLIPPVISVFKTITIQATFGGVFVSFENPHQADLAIHVIIDTTGLNTWSSVTTHYTGALHGDFSVRGLDSTRGKFGVYIEDHWNNKSDTLIESLTPLFEEPIPHNKFVIVHLENDFWEGLPNYPADNLMNGIYNVREDWFKSGTDIYPQWFTIDLGQEVVLSRMKYYNIIHYPWAADWVKEFEIWGSNALDPDWDNWQLLGQFEDIKPSGLPGSQYTADDLAYVSNGGDYSFPLGLLSVRYIRFKVINTWGGGGTFYTGSEMRFWGKIVH